MNISGFIQEKARTDRHSVANMVVESKHTNQNEHDMQRKLDSFQSIGDCVLTKQHHMAPMYRNAPLFVRKDAPENINLGIYLNKIRSFHLSMHNTHTSDVQFV